MNTGEKKEVAEGRRGEGGGAKKGKRKYLEEFFSPKKISRRLSSRGLDIRERRRSSKEEVSFYDEGISTS